MSRGAQCSQRWAVFISGTGSNLQALLECTFENPPVLVVSNSAKAPGLGKARRSGVATHVLSLPLDWKNLKLDLKQKNIYNLFLLGFMRILPKDFVEDVDFRILNLHPSLLPLYPGLRAFERAYEEQAPLGATVHEVVAQVDSGKILKQNSMRRASNFLESRLRLSFLEQSLVREVWANESF
ncbi:MAG: formyltransferase family protein [Bdellovibrionales bacterium]